MTIRLNKVARDLNVGIQTAVDFLQKKGFSIESNPNTKISDEQYALLVKEFSTDKNLKIESERISQERHNKDKNKATVALEGYEEPASDNESGKTEIATTIDEELKPRIKQVGKIDLDNLYRPVAPKKEEPEETVTAKEEKTVTEEPVQNHNEIEKEIQEEEQISIKEPEITEEPQTENIEEEEEEDLVSENDIDENSEEEEDDEPIHMNEETKEDEIFTLNRPKLTTNINVVGKIDLSALNQQTRPKKKTKEEKRKEREAKDKQRNDLKKPLIADTKTGESQETDMERKKRKRIRKEKIDIEKNAPTTNPQSRNNGNPKGPKLKLKKPVKAEIDQGNTGQADNQRTEKECKMA